MVTEQRISPYEIGCQFVALLGDDRSVVKNLWVRGNPDHVEMWLLTEPISYEHRLRLRALKRRLYEQDLDRDTVVELHIEHAGLYDVAPEEFVFDAPRGAISVAVR